MMQAVAEAQRPKVRHPFFRTGEPVVEEGRIIKGGMWPSGKLWWELPNFVRLLVGGYGSGKSMQLCKRHIALAIENAPIPTAIVSPTYAMARETIVPTLESLLSGQQRIRAMRGESLEFTSRKTAPYEFRLLYTHKSPTGRVVKKSGRILIYSGEHPERLKGTNLSSAGIDEPFIQDQEVFEQMVFRVRHREAKRLEVNLTGTPEQLNWGYDLAEGELADKYDVGLVQASTLENKALDPAYVKRLMDALDPKAVQAYVHGLFVNLAAGLVLYSFDRMENVVDLARPPGAELGAGLDFNVNPMTATVFWVIKKGRARHIHFFDEIELANSSTPEMCGELRDRYWDAGLREVYPDSNAGRSTTQPGGITDYHQLREAGFHVHKFGSGNPPLRDRFNAANGMFAPHAGYVRATVAPTCKKLIKAAITYSHELMRKQEHLSHIIDAATYPMVYLFPVKETSALVRVRGV